jgi:hypothetical protein
MEDLHMHHNTFSNVTHARFLAIEARMSRRHPDIDLSNVSVGNSLDGGMSMGWYRSEGADAKTRVRAVSVAVCIHFAREQVEMFGDKKGARAWLATANRINRAA